MERFHQEEKGTATAVIFGGNTTSQDKAVGKNEDMLGSGQQPTLAEIIIVIIATNIIKH